MDYNVKEKYCDVWSRKWKMKKISLKKEKEKHTHKLVFIYDVLSHKTKNFQK